jgi:hypothetical protein
MAAAAEQELGVGTLGVELSSVDPAVVESSVADATKPSQKDDGPRRIENLYASIYSFNVFTITDGAIRLIVLLHAKTLGFTPIQIALMFVLYELAGVVTNLFGGIAAVRYGLKTTLFVSVVCQLVGLSMLMCVDTIFGLESATPEELKDRSNAATVYITICQMISGISKDFMKVSCKPVPKLVTKDGNDGKLFKLVAIVTGLKNTFKGFGMVLGGVLVQFAGFQVAVAVLLVLVVIIVPVPLLVMDNDLGRGNKKTARFSMEVFRKPHNVNILSLARFFLFGARDVWYEIAAPIFLSSVLLWPDFTGD